MSTTLTQLDVWNIALDHLVEHPLASMTDTSSSFARWLQRNEANLRDVFLRMHVWNFAVRYHSVAKDSSAPAFRWDYRYKVPSDTLRVLQITYLGQREGNIIPHEVVGNWIYTDHSSPLKFRTIGRQSDFTRWDAMAVDAYALFLAHRMALRFTGKATYKDRLKEDAEDAIRQASEMDSIEGTAEPVEQHNVIDARSL